MDKRKIYDDPELKITKFDVEDVITDSDPELGEEEDGGGWA